MKTKFRLTQPSLIILLVALALFGAYIASITSQYEIVVRGILGIAVICLLFLYTGTQNKTESLDVLYTFPRNVKYLILTVIGTMASYWTIKQILDSILFFWNR